MPGKVFLLVFRDRVVAHALEKIIRIVVFADMIQTEAPIFRRVQPALRRAMGGGRVASRPFAGRKLGAQPAILIGLYPDAIERGASHYSWSTIMRVAAWHLQDLTGGKSAHGLQLTATHALAKPPFMHTSDLITEKLRNAFAPESLHVEDESHRHEGHAGHRPGGETHFRSISCRKPFAGRAGSNAIA